MHIELRQLRYFVAVAEERHFGKAALRLHMTQPPLSQAIQSFEQTLGTALFLRTKRSVTLTAAGEALLPEARRILQQAAALPELALRAASGAAGSMSLSFVSTADYSVLPSLLREFRERLPQVQIELREATTDVQIDDLIHRRIDAGLLIAPFDEQAKIELHYQVVTREPLVLAVPQGLIKSDGPARLSDVSVMPLIIFPRRIAPAFHDAILTIFRRANLTPRIGQEAIQMQTIVGLVSAGMGIALVPQSVSNLQRPGVEYKALPETRMVVETGLAWRRDNTSPVLQAFLELVRTTGNVPPASRPN